MSDFFAMGGYGAYVWSAYGLTAVVMAVNAIAAVRADRRALHQLSLETMENTHDTAA